MSPVLTDLINKYGNSWKYNRAYQAQAPQRDLFSACGPSSAGAAASLLLYRLSVIGIALAVYNVHNIYQQTLEAGS